MPGSDLSSYDFRTSKGFHSFDYRPVTVPGPFPTWNLETCCVLHKHHQIVLLNKKLHRWTEMEATSTFLDIIDSQDELFSSLHTRYIALAEERKIAQREKAAAALPGQGSVAVAPSPLSLQALLQKQNESATLVKRDKHCIEDFADAVRVT